MPKICEVNNIIPINRASAIVRIVSFCLLEGKELTLGCSNKEERYNELRKWFPDAVLEITDIGVKICNRKQ